MSTVFQVRSVLTEIACSIIEHLQRWRVNDSVWHGGDFSLFSGCEQLARSAGIELMKQRLTGRQQHRVSQVNADATASDYYKYSIWFTYLHGVLSHMCYKFSGAAETTMLLSSVLTCEEIQIEHLKKCLLCMANYLAALKKYC